MKRLPSIGGRLAHVLLGSALLWSLGVSLAVWLTVHHEAEELLDDTLRVAADVMAPALQQTGASAAGTGTKQDRFAWQLVVLKADGHATLGRASSNAPALAWHLQATAGFSDAPGWRVFGSPLGNDGSMLYVAQSLQERHEASVHVAFNTALATLAVALLAHLWLRSRAQRELDPLVRLSQRLAGLDLLAPGATVGAPERTELAPVHAAIDTLAAQLQRRVAHERAFTGHAAHALRTPLAGMDAQLAVALREAPAELQPRLRQVRAAAGRLQRVVAALLAMFRSGVALKWQLMDLQALLGRLPVAGLGVVVDATQPVSGDADLVSAALLNLLDNALRHGAQELTVSTPAPQCLRLQDDGPGVPAERRQALQAAIDGQAYQDRTGLGLMLADMVARAHGGLLRLPQSEHGFVVELQFGPAPS